MQQTALPRYHPDFILIEMQLQFPGMEDEQLIIPLPPGTAPAAGRIHHFPKMHGRMLQA
jgi:hypothetical protein